MNIFYIFSEVIVFHAIIINLALINRYIRILTFFIIFFLILLNGRSLICIIRRWCWEYSCFFWTTRLCSVL